MRSYSYDVAVKATQKWDPGESPHMGPVIRKAFSCHSIIMSPFQVLLPVWPLVGCGGGWRNGRESYPCGWYSRADRLQAPLLRLCTQEVDQRPSLGVSRVPSDPQQLQSRTAHLVLRGSAVSDHDHQLYVFQRWREGHEHLLYHLGTFLLHPPAALHQCRQYPDRLPTLPPHRDAVQESQT